MLLCVSAEEVGAKRLQPLDYLNPREVRDENSEITGPNNTQMIEVELDLANDLAKIKADPVQISK